MALGPDPILTPWATGQGYSTNPSCSTLLSGPHRSQLLLLVLVLVLTGSLGLGKTPRGKGKLVSPQKVCGYLNISSTVYLSFSFH